MFAFLRSIRNRLSRGAIVLSALAVAACDPGAFPLAGGGAFGPSIDPAETVTVALLVPKSHSGAASVAQGLENAARLAVASQSDAKIDLRVYDTAGDPERAAQQALQAVDDGAKIVIGPLFGAAANAAGVALAGSGVKVLTFSNNVEYAGGNVFLLGNTFTNTADRLAGYLSTQGINRYVSVYADSASAPTGLIGNAAIGSAVQANGGTVVASVGYELSQSGIMAAGPRVRAAVSANNAQAVFMTADVATDLPFLLTFLPEAGVDPATTQYVGLTRWNASPQIGDLPGAEGGIFAIPDQDASSRWNSSYATAYGALPHPLAGLGYDGVSAVASLIASGGDAFSTASITRARGFAGSTGAFRLLPNGTNRRALAVAQIRDQQVIVLDPAPSTFGGAGF
ncbi:penicillin-binding protein activator [Poseidonocella sedimentorum]|uniref:ABC-type branched-chain amino acid transport system, substrate-binding protein n=1 Tax=Poseidonocella sedimentorum TaxID=871652 RepID=A0A1I6DSB4_9RHOB|nr:penicillin-binding protein activator [Poseidonocella sedimentorum]SFR08335.1 ABC-type branched-chain amino acid transport system, substrate-binding protein [Poseidonocella sedimentorum]